MEEESIFDYSKLKSRIVEKFGNQKNFIEKIKMATPTFIQKIKRGTFNQEEIIEILNILDVPISEAHDYFFSIKS
ncbi:MAG: DUF739 family protein [Clostridia bacterium]|nr:DUF739 family protein [Clostridia bacterium]